MRKVAGYLIVGTCQDYLSKQARKIPGKFFLVKEATIG
jgi:hypothetical protein